VLLDLLAAELAPARVLRRVVVDTPIFRGVRVAQAYTSTDVQPSLSIPSRYSAKYSATMSAQPRPDTVIFSMIRSSMSVTFCK